MKTASLPMLSLLDLYFADQFHSLCSDRLVSLTWQSCRWPDVDFQMRPIGDLITQAYFLRARNACKYRDRPCSISSAIDKPKKRDFYADLAGIGQSRLSDWTPRWRGSMAGAR